MTDVVTIKCPECGTHVTGRIAVGDAWPKHHSRKNACQGCAHFGGRFLVIAEHVAAKETLR